MRILSLVWGLLWRGVLTFVLLLGLAIGLSQLLAPVYDFLPGTPFYGDTLHNPYAGLDSADFATRLKKVNLHAHQSPGRTILEPMHHYSPGEFESLYHSMGYDIAMITDHQWVNPLSPILGYEHGMNLSNFHLGVLGTDSVEWRNILLLLRPRSQMQWLVNRLAGQGEVLVLNHPSRLQFGSKRQHLSTLGGYDLIENDHTGPRGTWDIVLSAGHYPMVVSADDSHYPEFQGRFMNRYSMVLADSLEGPEGVLQALKRGHAYGVRLPWGKETKRGAGTEPRLRGQHLLGDTMVVSFVDAVDSLHFIGQNGALKKRVLGNHGRYVFTPQDTYIRVEAHLSNGSFVYLNPIARSSALLPGEQLWRVNTPLTILNWLLWLGVSAGILWLCVKLWRGRWARKN